MLIENVRVSKEGRDQLITLKRRTGISTWNILCRWAFCVSLAENAPPHDMRSAGEYPIEMTWKTFGGANDSIYMALLLDRCVTDGVELTAENIQTQLRLHLHRGISYLAADKKARTVEAFVGRVLSAAG